MSFYLAKPTRNGLEEISPDEVPNTIKQQVPTVKDVTLNKKEFLQRLTVAELNQYKAMAFDVLVDVMKESDDEYVSYMYALVNDVIDDDQPFFWPSRVVKAAADPVPTCEADCVEPVKKKVKHVEEE